MTVWAIRRLRCWWKGCDARPTYMPFGVSGGPVKVGWWCLWCYRTVVWDHEEWE